MRVKDHDFVNPEIKREIPILLSSETKIFGDVVPGRRVEIIYFGLEHLPKGREVYIETPGGGIRATMGGMAQHHHRYANLHEEVIL